MKLIKTKVEEVISRTKRQYKYFEGLSFKKEKIGVEWIVEFFDNRGVNYVVRLTDGRKANQFYSGADVWGMEGERGDGKVNLSYYWWTKKEFNDRLISHIEATKRCIENDEFELARLKTLQTN